ncbi:MAG: sensor histidine kinase [Nitrospirae bacterium]|nr:sensor histidine kinase [Nitrospirota bacterium]
MNEMDYIFERIERKQKDYLRYDFTLTENNALKTFFDLSQELDRIEDFYSVCVAIVKSFFNLNAALYVVNHRLNSLALVSHVGDKPYELNASPPPHIIPKEYPYYTDDRSLILTIRGKKSLMDQIPFHIEDDILGILEVYPLDGIDKHVELFFVKYANRIGFNIHNRFLVERNIEHLKFIRSLVADIEHNIIVPNMVYKLFLRGLRKKIEKNIEIEKDANQKLAGADTAVPDMNTCLKEISDVNQGLILELENIEKHYKNMSLFIETLFRKSHFDQGRLTLRITPCNIKKDVVLPQLERFLAQFEKMGISHDDRLSGIPDAEVITVVDVGIIAQVYANLFSNALKYTQEVITYGGEKKKYISYGHEIIHDFFGPGKNGVKLNVFSTGPHISPDERERLFDESYRGSNTEGKPGTGHGLSFIKNAVEIHGGIVGYEATQYGNNFYFILPK